MSHNPIIVGYDGSVGAEAALRWALDEARLRRAPVHLVCAVGNPLRTAPFLPVPGDWYPSDERHEAQALLDRAVTAATSATPPRIEITATVLDGPASTVLCEQSRHAGMLVLGHRGLGGFAGLLLGSVSLAVTTHAHCPVVIVRNGDQTQTAVRPVAVGVDESAEAERAIGFAFEEAALRGVGLLAVRAWTPPTPAWRSDIRPLVADVAEIETAERHVLSTALSGWPQKYPAVAVTTRLIPTDVRHALATVSHDAQLVVVGSRGHGGLGGLLLGSVGHHLLHHAACPVAVVRTERGGARHDHATSTR
jgi:nucleotide-binding universal stress UspA family protein